MNTKLSLFVIAPTLVAGSALVFALGRLSAPSAEPALQVERPPVVVSATDGAAGAPLEPLTRERATEPLPEGTQRGTVREILEAYYGLPWAEIERQLGPHKLGADAQARLLPWDSVAAEFRREILRTTPEGLESDVAWVAGWGTQSGAPDWYGASLNPAKKPLSQVDVQNLEHLANEYGSRLTDAVTEVHSMLPACMADQWDRGEYAKAPLVDTLESKREDKDGKSELEKRIGSSGGGWHVRYHFESRRYPELDRIAGEVRRLKSERLARVREYIAAL